MATIHRARVPNIGGVMQAMLIVLAALILLLPLLQHILSDTSILSLSGEMPLLWLEEQLNRLRDPQQLQAVLHFAQQILSVWLFALLLLPFAHAVATPGASLLIRLPCLLLILLFPADITATGLRILLSNELAAIGVATLRTASLAALWLLCTNTNLRAHSQFAATATPYRWLQKYRMVDLPLLLRTAPTLLAIATVYSLVHLQPDAAIADLALFLAIITTLLLTKLPQHLAIPALPACGYTPLAESLRLLISLVLLTPILIGSWLWVQQASMPDLTYLWWGLLVIPALLLAIPLALTTHIPYWLGWLVLLTLLLKLAQPSNAEQPLGWLSLWQSTALLWLHQLAITAWILRLKWRSFSNNQRHAFAMVHTWKAKLWAQLLAKPLGFATLTALLFGYYIAVQASPTTSLISALIALPLAACLGVLFATNPHNNNTL